MEYIQNLHFEKKKCRLTVQYLYIARVFTGKNNLAKRGKKGKKEGKRERKGERERKGRRKMCGSGFSVEDDRGISAILSKKRFIF